MNLPPPNNSFSSPEAEIGAALQFPMTPKTLLIAGLLEVTGYWSASAGSASYASGFLVFFHSPPFSE
jgi:hypothetical protein